MGEDLECLCQIMRTVGPRLDTNKAKVSELTANEFFVSYDLFSLTKKFIPVAFVWSIIMLINKPFFAGLDGSIFLSDEGVYAKP